MEFKQLKIPGVVLVKPDILEDNRGFFMESYHIDKFYSGGNNNVPIVPYATSLA